MTRTDLERVVRSVIERCRGPVEQALHDTGLAPRDVGRVVFVGGPTRMPAVRSYFEEIFGRKAEMGVDPMECVASGAAIQAGVLSGEVGDIVLVDVTPLTLGVETLGGVATPLITRNTPVPVKKSELFTTAADMQTSVTVHVFQGERPMAPDNPSLGEFNLDGLAPAPRGMPKIEVTFDIDSNGISMSQLKIPPPENPHRSESPLNPAFRRRRRRLIRAAEQYADRTRNGARKWTSYWNAADSACYQAERTLADFGDNITAELKGRIEAALREELKESSPSATRRWRLSAQKPCRRF